MDNNKLDRHGIRYTFEHILLPQCFFEEKAQFVGILLQDKHILFQIIDDIFKKEEVTNPYSEDDFSAQPFKLTEDILMLKIVFPEPEEEPLCYCSYLFFDAEFEKISYFCIEKGDPEITEEAFVCSWTPDGAHHNHGKCTFENKNDFLRCADIYMAKEYDETRDSD